MNTVEVSTAAIVTAGIALEAVGTVLALPIKEVAVCRLVRSPRFAFCATGGSCSMVCVLVERELRS